MVPYYILIGVPVIFSLIRIKPLDEKLQKRIAVIAFFSILFFLMSLKAVSVGNDTANYLYKFQQVRGMSWGYAIANTTEPAFVILIKIVQLFTRDYQIFLTVCAAIITVPMAWLYAKHSEIVALTIALFVIQSNFAMVFSGLRQSIAISLGVFAYEMVRRKKIVFFLLIVLLAFWFHNSAFMLLFLYPAYHLTITPKQLVFVIPVILVLIVFNRPIFSFLQTIISDYYINVIRETGAFMMLFLFILFAAIAYIFPDEDEMDEETLGMRNILLLAIVVQVFASMHPLAMRMGYYYTLFIPLLLPKIIVKSSTMRQFAIVSAVVMTAVFLIYFFVRMPSHDSLNIIPYRFFWEV